MRNDGDEPEGASSPSIAATSTSASPAPTTEADPFGEIDAQVCENFADDSTARAYDFLVLAAAGAVDEPTVGTSGYLEVYNLGGTADLLRGYPMESTDLQNAVRKMAEMGPRSNGPWTSEASTSPAARPRRRQGHPEP